MGKINAKIFPLLVVLVVAFAGIGLAKEKTIPLRLKDTTEPNNFELARELTGRDIAKETGITLQPVTVQGAEGGTVTMQALLANNLDICSGSLTIFVNVISKGAKVKLVRPNSTAAEPDHAGVLVLEKSNIRTIKDLVGKRIAVNVLAAEYDFIIRTFLKQNGLSINQVELVVIPPVNQEQALRTGQVDGIGLVAGSIYFEKAVENGGLRRIPGTSSYEVRGAHRKLVGGEGFRTQFIEEHPELVRAYVKAADTAMRLVYNAFQKNPEQVKKAYAKIIERKGGNPDLAKYYPGPRWAPEYSSIAKEDIQFWIDNFVEAGFLKRGKIKASDVYTNRFLPDSPKTK